MNKREMTKATRQLVTEASRPIRCPKGGATLLRKIGADVSPEMERQMVRTLTALRRQGLCRPRYDGAGQPSSDRLLVVEPLA